MANSNSGYLKLNNEPVFMALTVEIIEDNQVSLCHYGEQSGDLMRDPEVVFFKDNDGDYFPFYFRNDYLGIEEWYAEANGDSWKICNQKGQKDLALFCNSWIFNIKSQQGLF